MTGLEMIEDRVDIRSGMRLYCGGRGQVKVLGTWERKLWEDGGLACVTEGELLERE